MLRLDNKTCDQKLFQIYEKNCAPLKVIIEGYICICADFMEHIRLSIAIVKNLHCFKNVFEKVNVHYFQRELFKYYLSEDIFCLLSETHFCFLSRNFLKMRNDIRDIEPSTSCLRRNVYHLHVPLFVLDVVRLFQDHPKYCRGLKDCHIIQLMEKESYACGDIESQVKMAIKELTASGFVRCIGQGYRTLGPFAKLGTARTPRQLNTTWDRLSDMQKISCSSIR